MRRSTTLLLALALAIGAAWVGCISPAPEPARLRVEIFSGFAEPPLLLSPSDGRVDVLLDLTSSMETAITAGPSRAVAARSAAAQLLHSIPRGRTVALHALGVAEVDEACQPAFRIEQVGTGESRGGLFTQLESMRPRGEGSFAQAIDGLRVYLGVREELARSRVVILSDFDDACGGDLCAPVEGLVAGGARVDIVVLGELPVPACLARFDPVIEWGSEAVEGELAPSFRVDAATEDPAPDALPLALGRAGAGDLRVPAGRAFVTLMLDEPVRIGPIELLAGETTQLRVLDFPAADPAVREWLWEILPSAAADDEDAEDDAS